MAQLGIDVSNVPQSVSRDVIMFNGWFKSIITESEIVPSKTNPETDRRLKLEFKIVEGEFAGRTFSGGLNIVNQNPKAQQIAMSDLSAIGHSVGCVLIQDSQQLHNIPMWVKLKFVEASGAYGAKNEPHGYKNASEKVDAPTPVISQGPTAGPAAPAPAAFAPPATFTPPGAPVAPAAAPAWQAPAATQPWAAPITPVAPAAPVAPVYAAPAAPAAPVYAAPAPVQQFAPAAPAAPAAPVQQPAIDPTTGLAVPPWQQQAAPAAQ